MEQFGFTLIETLLYVVLFSFIMVGALISIYGIIGSSARNQTRAMVEEEGSFIIGKIDWALTGIENVSVTSSGRKLTVVKSDSSIENPIIISFANGNISIQRGTNPSEVLNNTNAKISCPLHGCFVRTAGTGDGSNPESVSSEITITALTSEGAPISEYFSTIKYVRK